MIWRGTGEVTLTRAKERCLQELQSKDYSSLVSLLSAILPPRGHHMSSE